MNVIIISALSSSDIIGITAIVVNAIIGIILVVIISKRVSDKRALKDYFIGEISQVRDSYRKFIAEVLQNKSNSRHIITWFQVMNIRLNNIETILQERNWCFKLETRELNINLREIITNSDEFNEQFNEKIFSTSANLKSEIIKIQGEISMSLLKTVININKN